MTLLRGALLLALASTPAACGLARDTTDEHDMSALMRASRDGNVTEVSRLLAEGARVNQAVKGHSAAREFLAFIAWMQSLPKRDGGYRALHYAAAGGHRDVARRLLDAGAEPGAAARAGETPLSLAAWRGDLELVRLLLDAGAPARRPPDLAESRPWNSPVGAAVFARHEPVVRLLLERGADADPGPRTGMAPLATAASHGDSAIVRLLLAYRPDVNRAVGEGQTPLILAARAGHVAIVRALLAAGADPERRDARAGWTAAQWAASSNHDSVVALFHRTTPSTAGTGDIELVQAVQLRDLARVRTLLAAGASPHTRTSSGAPLLVVSVALEEVEITRALLEAGADWRRVGESSVPLLHTAAQRGNAELVQVLLGAGALARVGGTATYAASSGNLEVLRLVQDSGADLREANDEPLRAAAIAGSAEAVRYLLARGAAVDAPDANARTALGRSVAFRQHDAVRVLLEAGANPRQQAPESGWTPLMSAAMSGDSLMIAILMNAGADASVRDREGKTAADYARGAGNAHVIPLLRRSGAR